MRACLVVLAFAALSGCGGGGSTAVAPAPDVGGPTTQPTSGYPADPASCDVAGQRAWLRDYMNDQYYWYDQQRAPDAEASSQPQYFASLLFAPTDRYSFTQSTAEFTQFFGPGQAIGYGYALAWADAAQTVLKVRTVEPLSPIGLAGLRRGDTIVTIDGYTPDQVINGRPARVKTVGVARKFVVTDATGKQRTLDCRPCWTRAYWHRPTGPKWGIWRTRNSSAQVPMRWVPRLTVSPLPA